MWVGFQKFQKNYKPVSQQLLDYTVLSFIVTRPTLNLLLLLGYTVYILALLYVLLYFVIFVLLYSIFVIPDCNHILLLLRTV